jgi:uncharacterized OB-fold protein
MAQVPVAEGIFTWPSDNPQLIGSRCTVCGLVTFPTQGSCARCGSTAMEEHLLARRGRLWAWTTQDFPPPAPPYTGPTGDDFVPFGIGYIELDDEVKVEARLTEADPDALKTGMEMELVVVPFRTDDDNEVMTFAFQPVR